MATQLQVRRGTTAQMNAFTGAEGEIAVNTSTDTVHVHDGSTAGGFALAKADGSNIGTYAGSFTTLAASGAVTLSSTLAVTGTVTANTSFATGVGIIKDIDGNSVMIGAGAVNLRMIDVTGDIRPVTADGLGVDATIDLGDASARFKDLYLSGGVNPTANVNGNAFTQPNNGSDSITAGWISSSFGKNSNKVVIGSHSSQAVVGAHNNDLNGWADLHLQATNIKFLNTAGGQTAVINSAGNLGINTSNPQLPLHVKGDFPTAVIERDAGAGGAAGLVFTNSTTNGVYVSGSDTTYTVGNVTDYEGSPSYSERMRLTAGKLGINNSNPAYSLSICNPANPNRNGIEISIGASDTALNTIQNYNRATGAYTPLNIAGSTIAFGVGPIALERLRIASDGSISIPNQNAINELTFTGTEFTNVVSATNSGFELGTTGSGYLRFLTNNATAMHINSSGEVGIGLSNHNHVFQVLNDKGNYSLATFTSTSAAATEYGPAIILTNDPNDTTRYFMYFAGGGTSRLIMWSNGNIQNTNNSYSAISDVKLKENIVDAGSQWDDIKALRVRKYSLKEENSSEPTQIGVIAQEVEAAGMAGLVYESPDQIEADDGSIEDTGEVTKGMKYSILYMKAIKALQEAMERIETLEAKVQTLENN